MKRIALLFLAVAILAGAFTFIAPVSGQSSGTTSPVFVTAIPPGYRDWRLISVAHEEGDLHSFAAVLGNDAAIKANRESKLPFPDGAIIAALHSRHVSSEENNNVFGRAQSSVPGQPTNLPFMVKDSKKCAATGGWGFAHFNRDGTFGNDALMKTCFPRHAKASRDLVFIQHAP